MAMLFPQVSLLLEDALHLQPQNIFNCSYILLLPYIDQLQAYRHVTDQVRPAVACSHLTPQHLSTSGALNCVEC
jgi:hypothetical protein